MIQGGQAFMTSNVGPGGGGGGDPITQEILRKQLMDRYFEEQGIALNQGYDLTHLPCNYMQVSQPKGWNVIQLKWRHENLITQKSIENWLSIDYWFKEYPKLLPYSLEFRYLVLYKLGGGDHHNLLHWLNLVDLAFRESKEGKQLTARFGERFKLWVTHQLQKYKFPEGKNEVTIKETIEKDIKETIIVPIYTLVVNHHAENRDNDALFEDIKGLVVIDEDKPSKGYPRKRKVYPKINNNTTKEQLMLSPQEGYDDIENVKNIHSNLKSKRWITNSISNNKIEVEKNRSWWRFFWKVSTVGGMTMRGLYWSYCGLFVVFSIVFASIWSNFMEDHLKLYFFTGSDTISAIAFGFIYSLLATLVLAVLATILYESPRIYRHWIPKSNLFYSHRNRRWPFYYDMESTLRRIRFAQLVDSDLSEYVEAPTLQFDYDSDDCDPDKFNYYFHHIFSFVKILYPEREQQRIGRYKWWRFCCGRRLRESIVDD